MIINNLHSNYMKIISKIGSAKSQIFNTKNISSILIISLPIISLMPRNFIQGLLILTVILGFFELFRRKYQVNIRYIIIGIVLFIYFLTLFLQSSRVNQTDRFFHFGGGEYFFLVGPLISFAFVHTSNAAIYWFINSCKIAIFLVFIWLLYKFIGQDYSGRVLWHAQLGAIILSLSWCAINKESNVKFSLTMFVSLLGVLAISLSGTRSAVILLSSLSIIFVILNLINKKNILRMIIFFLFINLVILLSGFLLENLNYRFLSGFAVLNDNVVVYSDSAKIRLDIYKTALKVGAEKWFAGYGYEDPIIALQPLMSEGLLLASQGHTYLHNSYLDSFIVGGVIQLFFLFGVFFIYFYYFYNSKFEDDDFLIKCMALVLLVAYIISSSFESMFVGAYECGFFVLTACFLSSRKQCNKNP